MEIFERILMGSFQLFAKYGIKSVTMDDIAKEIGISKKTIYENFRDKDDLLKQGLLYHKRQQDATIMTIITTTPNVLEAIYKVMFEASAHMHGVNPTFFSDLKKYHFKLCEDFMPKHQKEKLEIIKELLRKGVEQGIFRDNVNLDLTAKIFNYQFNMLADEEAFPIAEFSRADIYRNIIEYFTRALATPKGTKIIEKIIEKNKKI